MQTINKTEHSCIPWDDRYNIRKKIGNGSFGDIFKAKCPQSKKILSLKRISIFNNTKTKRIDETHRQQAITEGYNLKQMQHEHILLVIGENFLFEYTNPRGEHFIYIVTEHCENGDLNQMITNKKNGNDFISRRLIIKWLVQLSSALAHMHEKGIIHRDINPKNIFLKKLNRVKLGDFGLARNVSDSKLSFNNGSLGYQAPELLLCPGVKNLQSDCWSFGCIMYELLHLRNAIMGNSIVEFFDAIKTKPIPALEYEEYEELFQKVMKRDPKERIDAKGIKTELEAIKAKILLDKKCLKENIHNNHLKFNKGLRLIDDKAFRKSKLSHLNLSGNSLTLKEEKRIFYRMTSLQELILNDNQIATLNKSLFSSLTKLKILWLQNNKINKITNKVFSQLVNLQTLYLCGNEISEIENGAFDKLVKLDNLCLSGQTLASIPNDLFKNLANLKKLHFKVYKGKLMLGTFDNLKELTELDLTDGALDSLEVVKPLSKLTKLDVTKNSLEKLNLDILESLVGLNQLNLSHNMIKLIYNDLPAKETTSRLDTIDLSGNKLTTITKNCWVRMPNLVVIKLDKNQIASLEKNAFIGLRSLEELSLTENNFSVTENEATLINIPEKAVLKLSGNRDLEKINYEPFNSKSINIEAISSPPQNQDNSRK